MFGGIWNVYTAEGVYLGRFQTRLGDDVLQVDAITASQIETGTILHMDETDSAKAWEVEVTGNHRGRVGELVIKKISDRAQRYPDKKHTVVVITHQDGRFF